MPTAQPRRHDRLAASILLAFALVASAGAQETGTAPRPALTDAQKERFLLRAKILKRRGESQKGIGTERATLALDGLEHDALIQLVEEYDLNVQVTGGSEIGLRDNWRNNVAAYRLDRLLGLGMVPVTVERRDDLKEGSFTWWVDDFLMDERARLKKKVAPPDEEAWKRQWDAMRVFDHLVYNFNRDAGDVLVDKEWRIWLLGHSRAFKGFEKLKAPKSLEARCPRGLLDALRRLDKPRLEQAMAGALDPQQIDGLLARREAIVTFLDKRIAELGEEAVLYDLPSR